MPEPSSEVGGANLYEGSALPHPNRPPLAPPTCFALPRRPDDVQTARLP